MTISSSLNAGIAGLMANATRLATISDNIANSETNGYKRTEADFHSMVLSSSGGTYAAGGVRTTTQRMIDERGTLVATSNPTDLAVRGRGMLPVARAAEVKADNGGAQLLLSSTGSFRTDSDGYLRSEAGLVLMGWPASSDGTMPTYPRDTAEGLEPIRVNQNQFSSDPTRNVEVRVNLPATQTAAGATGENSQLSVEYYGNLGTSESLMIDFVPTVPSSGSSNEWTMVLRDTATPGVVVGQYTLAFDDSQTAGGTLASVSATSGGAYDPATGNIEVTVGGGTITLNIGELGAADGFTQLSDRFAPVSINKDGTPIGNMTNVEVDPNGRVQAFFDTGVTRMIYQIPLVAVPNPNGMVSLDQQTYAPSPDSGAFFLWNAGDGPTGDIVAFAREESTTDVAGELTSMIQTQRAYTSNAKVIQTVDEMLQETANIKR